MFHVERHGDDVSLLRMDDGRVNALGPEFLREFPRAFAEAASGGRAVVLTGNARVFSAGLDLKTVLRMTRDEVTDLVRGFGPTFRAPLAHEGPVVAAVNGPAIAGGAVLALACEFRVAARDARMGVTEVPVGVPFPPAVLRLVRDRLPAHEHAPALLQGVLREGDDLAARGWAHRVAPRADVEADALALARDLAAATPRAYGGTKAQANRALVEAFDHHEKEGAAAWAAEVDAPDARAAIQRTLERLARR